LKIDGKTRLDALGRVASLDRTTAWRAGVVEALKGVEIPGDLDELAEVERASIEADGSLNVFVAEWEEGVTFTPDELREHAFELLALAELAEVAS
jgi:hypothetical protein